MSNQTALTFSGATNVGAMTNKYNLWTGTDPTMLVESNAGKTHSLTIHPSTSTYGWTVGAFPQGTFPCNIPMSQFVSGLAAQTIYQVRVNNTIGVGAVNGELGLAKSTATTKWLGWKLKNIKRYNGTLLVVD